MLNQTQRRILIVLLSIFILIGGWISSSYFHEAGHKEILEKNGINCEIELKFPNLKYNSFEIAECKLDKEGCLKVNDLTIDKKSESLLAGVKNQGYLLEGILVVIFAVLLINLLIKIKDKNSIFIEDKFNLILVGSIILLFWWNINNIFFNLEYLPKRDFYHIFNNYIY
jgi:hypothetical protein